MPFLRGYGSDEFFVGGFPNWKSFDVHKTPVLCSFRPQRTGVSFLGKAELQINDLLHFCNDNKPQTIEI